ncbi:MAG: YitT family protein [Ruminococcus sp.]
MKNENMVRRYIILLAGLIINGLGVALITKASIGTSPISSVPYVLSLNFTLTIGVFTIIFNVLLVAAQICILRKKFPVSDLLQLPVTFLFSLFIDLFMMLLSGIDPGSYFEKIFWLSAGCIILGFGVYTEVAANVVMLPGEAFVRAVTTKFPVEFGKMKVIFDVSCTASAALISLILTGTIEGVREGTLIAALFLGTFVRICRKVFLPLERKLLPDKKCSVK